MKRLKRWLRRMALAAEFGTSRWVLSDDAWEAIEVQDNMTVRRALRARIDANADAKSPTADARSKTIRLSADCTFDADGGIDDAFHALSRHFATLAAHGLEGSEGLLDFESGELRLEPARSASSAGEAPEEGVRP